MTQPAIVRAAYLQVFIDLLREIGVPVTRALERSALPTWIEDMPDAYVSLPLAIDWAVRGGRDVEPMEFGYRAAMRQSLATMGSEFRRALLDSPTGLVRMRTFLSAAVREDSSLSTRSWRERDHVRLVCNTLRFDGGPSACLAEWGIIQALVDTMRSVAGPKWYPEELTFVSSCVPSATVFEAYSNTRIMVGFPHTSILVKAADLARPCAERVSAASDPTVENWEMDFTARLRAVLRPYLGDGYPSINQTAEIIGMSSRTLQRKLRSLGQTYTGILAGTRIEQASKLLSDSDIKIVDIALALGYEDPQNFSRIFRRMTGMTPSAYRQSVLAEL
ncbi:helix-turn-helix domain-containing protein [Paracoccus sp. MBLB3053]|uniref:Helix-turn-helix domain-containing protein n=1 Tax=Paracoccus aurantius TaxID=3073814 RepID=A0ABU2HYW8_9RHOB|nr:helix-turn-helix domain-containing protein [Paracoccus sp. MBLB3053]MDS9470258.1 helix-turn-helix domain-containing protein [Paracoccus sp. MBLB3053]